jgi:DNA modification methylase
MKPVALVERAIRNSSKSWDVVLDPFGELDPRYVDVIAQRWQNLTGKRATHAVTKETFGLSDTPPGGVLGALARDEHADLN